MVQQGRWTMDDRRWTTVAGRASIVYRRSSIVDARPVPEKGRKQGPALEALALGQPFDRRVPLVARLATEIGEVERAQAFERRIAPPERDLMRRADDRLAGL